MRRDVSFEGNITTSIYTCQEGILVPKWKKEPQEKAASIFGEYHTRKKKQDKELVARLYQQIGQLKIERGFLEGVLRRLIWNSGALYL